MGEVYRCREPQEQGSTEALVIHCSAARFQQYFDEFLTQGLGLGRYSVIAVPGGAQVMTLVDYLPKFAWAGWRWTKFLVDVDKAPRVILIGHEECRWYHHLRFWDTSTPVRGGIVRDLERVRAALRERYPGVQVDLYYARMDGGRVVFDSL